LVLLAVLLLLQLMLLLLLLLAVLLLLLLLAVMLLLLQLMLLLRLVLPPLQHVALAHIGRVAPCQRSNARRALPAVSPPTPCC
jgi:hypothetical protein